jgi:hypothetical protein
MVFGCGENFQKPEKEGVPIIPILPLKLCNGAALLVGEVLEKLDCVGYFTGHIIAVINGTDKGKGGGFGYYRRA